MSSFDSVYAACPKCKDDVEFQSTAGPCVLNVYVVGQHFIPVAIAADLDGDVQQCINGHDVRLGLAERVIRQVPMVVEAA